MDDLFADTLKHIGLFSEGTLYSMFEIYKGREVAPDSIAGEIVAKHVALLLLVGNYGRFSGVASLREPRTSWEEANAWCLRVIKLAEDMPDAGHRESLLAMVKNCRERHASHSCGDYGQCVVCGEDADDKHQCDPKLIARYESAMATDRDVRSGNNRTVGDRIREGFDMMNEMG